MKNTKLSKILTIVLVAVLFSCVAFAVAASAEEQNPTIIGKNILYTDKTAIQIAVDQNTVDANDLSLVVTGANGVSVTYYDFEISEDADVLGAYVFTVEGLPASAICDVLTFVVKSGDNESDPFTYSVAEYFYERLYSDGIVNATEGKDAARKEFYETYIENGAAAQELFRNYDVDGNYVGGTTLVTDYNVLAIQKGTLSNGKEVILSTEPITSTVNATAALKAENLYANKWTATTYAGEITTTTVNNGDEVTAEGLVVVTPVYVSGDFFINENISGQRYNFNGENPTLPTLVLGTATSAVTKDDILVFSRVPDTSSEGYLRFLTLGTVSDTFVFEADTRFGGFTVGNSSVGKIRFRFEGYENQINVVHDGNTIKFAPLSGTGSVTVSENEWYNIRFEMTLSTKTFNIFVNNEYRGSVTSTQTTTSGSTDVLYYLISSGSNGVVEFDNVFYGFVKNGTPIPEN